MQQVLEAPEEHGVARSICISLKSFQRKSGLEGESTGSRKSGGIFYLTMKEGLRGLYEDSGMTEEAQEMGCRSVYRIAVACLTGFRR